LNILFYNTFKTKRLENINRLIVDIALEKKCDLLVLAEYGGSIDMLCSQINSVSKAQYKPIPNNGGCGKIYGLIKGKYSIESIQEQSRYQIVMVETTLYKLIIGMIHNVSPLYASALTQLNELSCFYEDICDAEDRLGTRNTMLIGDFNVNPFDYACIAANTLHAIPYREEVKSPGRTVMGRKYLKFYNPTWKLLGKREPPYATYYQNRSDIVNYYWHMFDQVLIRPQLASAFDEGALAIVTETESHKLLLEGYKPNSSQYSDHLPLYCELKEANMI